ncbi:hypothetical protein HPB50_009361 [Hyalomma asiaticum]|uniref:Uncharacterized protein n=1 Tax=Hyalomma asiaticum TaxID=266040 RepID=A0ACB7THD5_HYAAI|nr:hypothetical protein HPB50_009361 [Hyalomma asiaticum]
MRAIQMNRGHRPFYGPARHWTRPYPPASECPHNRHQRRTPAGGHRTIATWTILDSAGSPVGWASRLPWELQPRPAIGDPPAAASESFRGNLLTERYPLEPLATYTPEEARLLGPTCGEPEIHRRQHQNGAVHQTRVAATASHCRSSLQASASRTAIEAAVAIIRTLRPQLLRDEPPRNETPPSEETMHLLDLDMDK